MSYGHERRCIDCRAVVKTLGSRCGPCYRAELAQIQRVSVYRRAAEAARRDATTLADAQGGSR